MGKAVTDHSQVVYEALSVANTLDLYDKDLSEERRKYQVQASREITMLLASLRVFYSITKMDSDKMQYVLQKTVEVERMIKKWIDSDKVRLGASLHVLRKDIVDTSFLQKQITASDIIAPRGQVDFDTILKDAKDHSPANFHLDPEKPRYIPPASEAMPHQKPNINYIPKTDEERAAEVATSRFEFNPPVKKDVGMLERKTRNDYAIPTKPFEIKEESTKTVPTVNVTVPAHPIVVPDDRILPGKPVDLAKEAEKPLAPTVEISKESLPLSIAEDIEKPAETTDK